MGKPDGFSISDFVPEKGKGLSVSRNLYIEKLIKICWDRLMGQTGDRWTWWLHIKFSDMLQWCICSLYLNQLNLRHVFTALDEKNSPGTFNGPNGNNLTFNVSN